MSDATEQIADDLSVEGRRIFTRRIVRKTFARGATVVNKGDSVAGAYFVLSGALRVFTLGKGGKQTALYRMSAGESCVLAINSLFQNLPYPAWVEAERETLVAVVPGDVFRSLFSREPRIQDIVVSALSSAVFGLMGELERLSQMNVEQRLVAALLRHGVGGAPVRRTQQELAVEIGAAREVVGRLLPRFARQGLVKTGRGIITIIDRQRLRAIIEGEE